MNKKAILVVSFGTSYEDIIKRAIEPVEKGIAQALPSYDLFRAFTSRMIINKLKITKNISIDDTPKALEKIFSLGYREIIVQSLHILPGTEYHDLKAEVETFQKAHDEAQIAFGKPLFFDNNDYAPIVEALMNHFPDRKENEPIILMGHGTPHYCNACYFALQYYLDKAGANAYVANVESEPFIQDIIPKLKEKGIKKAHLMPLMLVSGDHAQNDMAGDEEDSWNTLLKNEGIESQSHLIGLGENQAFRQFFIRNALECSY